MQLNSFFFLSLSSIKKQKKKKKKQKGEQSDSFNIYALLAAFCFLFQLTFLHPPVRATVGEVRYSIEIDVGGGVKGQFYKTRF